TPSVSDEPQTPERDPGEPRMELPTWNRSRTKRRGGDAVPTDDAFQGAVKQAGRSAAQRGRLVIVGVLLAAAGVVGAVVWQATSTSSSAQATRLLAGAAAMESRGQIGDAQSLLGQASEHPPFPIVADEGARKASIDQSLADLQSTAAGSGAARAAGLLEGAEHMREGDFAGAEKAYRGYLDAEPRSPIAFLAREGLALALEAQGDVDGALRELRALAGDKGSFYREMALYHQARLLAAASRKDEAIAALKTYTEEYPIAEPSLAREQIRALAEVVDPTLLAGADTPPPSVEIVDGGAAP
ncbi:MAG: tetratricopeptide repeat protein, partial [Nannocystaceae bacterium]